MTGKSIIIGSFSSDSPSCCSAVIVWIVSTRKILSDMELLLLLFSSPKTMDC